MQNLEIRAQKGKEISGVFGSINRLDEATYKVKSQRLGMYYEVLRTYAVEHKIKIGCLR